MLKLDKKKKYILGCSFGPDSMALFFMLLKENYDFVVCNIDYNYRPESKRETDSIEAVCKQKNIRFYTKNVLFSTNFHNFEARARKIRYDFFKEIGRKIGYYNILIAHQRDDLIETYLMQKERKSIVTYYGLNKSYQSEEFTIHRPLLKYTKKQLIEYCKKYKIEYSIDPTNFDQSLRRNFYRHSVLPTFSEEKTKEILQEIKEANKLILKEERYIEKHLKNDKILLKHLLNKNDEFIVRTLIYILEKNNLFVEVSFGTAKELKKSVDNNKPWIWKINSDYEIRIDYDFLALINKKINYSLPIENEIIKLNKSSNLFDLLKKHDILEIKPAKVGYFYKINENKKTINRIFIDQKMPHFTRNIWPAIFDKNNNIVYMPRYRKKYKINNNSLLIFDVDELYEFVKKEH